MLDIDHQSSNVRPPGAGFRDRGNFERHHRPKNSEQLLREQNERNRLILETANEAFIGMDPDGTITAWNPQSELTFGWTAGEAIGRTLCDTVVAPAYRAAHASGVEQFLTTTEGSQLNRRST